MAEAIPVAKQMCTYKHGDWGCPFDAEEGHDLCIFHLPIDKKRPEDFWRHLANYLLVLCRLQGPRVEVHVAPDTPWVNAYEDNYLLNYYDFRRPQGKACFVGFRFPAMDAQHSLMSFTFGIPADFSNARFGGWANFISATFSASANFRDARFSGEAILFFATFSGTASFGDATFDGTANLAGATFSGEASFGSATFGGKADFNHATFSGPAHFPSVKFSGAASFFEAKFKGAANFRFATFGGEADFSNAEFNEPVYMLRTTAEALLDFTHARLRNRLLFDGASFGDAARVLLWGIDFVHGTSDIAMEKGHEKGRIIAPAGQVVFRDISTGMDRVSFLHTDILTDRLLVRFFNVKWKTDPDQFIFDARFVLCRDTAEWQEATGLHKERIASLRELFHTERRDPSVETAEQKQLREAQELADCMSLVRQDVVRIAREIRRSTEEYGSYSDAGDFHIAEMEYRRVQAPRFSFQRLLLAGYKCFSEYGESPRRAFKWFFGVWLVSALLYMFAGFTFGKTGIVRYALALDKQFAWSAFWRLCVDFLHALAFSFVSMVPGYFRFTAPAEWPTPFSPFIVVVEAVFGIGLLTLFLLAIRRRFRR